ncbi:MAG: hypothetical protein CFE24_06290 [Flavobacterium sp. BFFFF2]|nr:MAG: hypothetical protein CFE24_06290 [Flavobacterium sp. BFFFF2]
MAGGNKKTNGFVVVFLLSNITLDRISAANPARREKKSDGSDVVFLLSNNTLYRISVANPARWE